MESFHVWNVDSGLQMVGSMTNKTICGLMALTMLTVGCGQQGTNISPSPVTGDLARIDGSPVVHTLFSAGLFIEMTDVVYPDNISAIAGAVGEWTVKGVFRDGVNVTPSITNIIVRWNDGTTAVDSGTLKLRHLFRTGGSYWPQVFVSVQGGDGRGYEASATLYARTYTCNCPSYDSHGVLIVRP